ncbi:ABC transporter permease [Paenibacillus sp. GbtcB18]|uniref:ABC transporter permease n=1 Tax=Paenibacillus sp. GbtcB18 TaxID=2824763 RepID=UPI001C2FDCD3|nr:ABC transporter permease [Paenibacillus sp. GbtcB18]
MNAIKTLFKNKNLIWELSKKDIKAKYLGSYLGILWAFVHPIITILVYWFVFQVGLKSNTVNDFPFILWLLPAIIPWFFISESISSATNSIIESSYLVKKIVFKVSILPLIKIISSLIIHLFFIVVLLTIFVSYGYGLSWYHLQIFYYLLASIGLIVGISYITAALNVFLKDVGQFVAMFLQFFFWLTPIFWNLNIVSKEYQFYFKLNPVYYIVSGFRDTFINKEWFWEHPYLTIYFWTFTCIVILVGVKVFKKLKIHFADVI